MLDDITPLVLTRDEAPNIARTLGQLRWARDVVVLDSGSVDDTVSIARTFPNVRVVTPEVGLAPDVEAAGAGVVTTPDNLADTLNALLHDRARREAMGKNGRALVEARFTWDRVAAEMEEHYPCSTRSRR